MNKQTLGRRHFLKTLTAIGTAGLAHCVDLWIAPCLAADAAAKTAYDPAAKFEITVSEVEMRRNSAGRMLKARIYQPKGPGPFPTVLDLHGGAWNAKDRTAEEPMDRAIAEQRRARGRHRYDVGKGSSVPGLRSGCKLRRALAEIESGHVEWRSVKDRHLRKFERRPRRRTSGHAPARSALQRHSTSPKRRMSTPAWHTPRCARRSAIRWRATRMRRI